jgi:PAS domain S-box-containing protein
MSSPAGAVVTTPASGDKVNILLVDDQPAKLLSYEVILGELGENLIPASSAREALEHLLKTDVAVVLVDVCMPELDGFELAAMIREHPRFRQTAIIFVSAVQIADPDRLRGYEAGAVDYVPVPVVPEVLRAKVKVFAELHRKTRQLERLNRELEMRVIERTAALEASTAQLRESEQRRSVALAAGQMGSWDWDIGSGAVTWDAGQHRIFGVEPGELPLTLDTLRPYIHADDLATVEALVATRTIEANTFQTEVRILQPEGDVRWCICAAAATLNDTGRVVRVSGVTIDITERKEAEQTLQRLNEELEQRVEERTREREQALAQLFEAQKLDTIGQLTGGVAHDFNNLLMAIMGSLELLGKRLPEEPRARRLLDNAVQGAQRGAALTQRLLAFARRQELKPEAVDLPSLVSGMEQLLERALGPGVRMVKDVPATLAPVHVDGNQLELGLLNLTINARDAMPLGGTLTITASEEAAPPNPGMRELSAGKYVCVRVSDTGLGMDSATLAKAKEPFFTTKGPGKGTGLGLSMVDGLVAQSGGMLKVSSEPGKGTTVDLWLPCADAAVAPVSVEPPPERAESRVPRTVLLVDDDPLVLAGTSAMLEDLGHIVIEATTGLQALELLNSGQRVDLVITDHAMPGMTGAQLAAHIRQVYAEMPVVLATGYVDLPHGDREDLGLPRLSKPYRLDELASAVASATRHYRTNVIPLRVS